MDAGQVLSRAACQHEEVQRIEQYTRRQVAVDQQEQQRFGRWGGRGWLFVFGKVLVAPQGVDEGWTARR